jgi:hypothetical protein
MRDNKTVNWVAGVVVVAAGAWLGLFLYPFPPGIDTRLHKAVGETLATEAIKIADPSARVFVLARDTAEFQVPATVAQLDGLQQALKAAGRPAAIMRVFKADPLRVVEVPPGDFFDLLRQGKETDVFISFLGPPNLVDAQIAKLEPNKRPKVIALCTGPLPRRVDLKKSFAQQLLHAAVVSRPDAPAQAGPGEAKAAFAQLFNVITPANLTELDALLTTSKD